MTQARKQVAVIGLGKLGLCLASVLASKGYSVSGVDTDVSKVEQISKGKSTIYEPLVEKLVRQNRNRISVSSTYDQIESCDAIFVIVPTPSERTGEFSLHFVKQAMNNVGEALAKVSKYRLVVLTSTVMPGSMDNVVLPTLEASSCKKCREDFGLCYNPEFIALGDVIRGMMEPDFVLIGESDRRAGNLLLKIQKDICNNSPKFERMNFVNAELAKISLNSFVTMKMSFANTLAEICEKMPGGDVDKVTKAIGRDNRVGAAYLRGALGYGGPCFPRDNIAFSTFANRMGAQAKIALATNEVNLGQVERIIERIESEGLSPPLRISILGLSYKPNTNVTEASQSLALAESLAKKGFEVHVFDPSITTSRIFPNSARLIYEKRPEDCIRNSEVCIIATPWDIFSRINKSEFKNKIVFDCWRIFDELPGSKKYIRLGLYSPTPKLISA